MRNALPFLFFLLLLSGCRQENQVSRSPQKFQGRAIGTYYSIILFADEVKDPKYAVDSIIDRFNRTLSTYVEDSQINKFNAGTGVMEVDSLFAEVFTASKEVHRATQGYFDPTIGNVVNAYGFGSEGEVSPPDSNKLAQMMQLVGMEKIDMTPLDNGRFRLSKSLPGVYIEFNAIAKGLLVDHIGRYLERQGVDDYLLEIGGEVRAMGRNRKKQKPWSVGIEDPIAEPNMRSILATVTLKSAAMAGSGNYRKTRTDPETGKTYVHTVNPLTGTATQSRLLAVNAIAGQCMYADAYATAFMAMPLDLAREKMQELEEVEILLVYTDQTGELTQEMTPGFKRLLNSRL